MPTLCRSTFVLLGSLAALSAWGCKSAEHSLESGTRMPNPSGCYVQVWDAPKATGMSEFTAVVGLRYVYDVWLEMPVSV